MERKEKRPIGFNVIDLVILLTVAAVIVGCVLRYGSWQNAEPEQLAEAELRFRIEELSVDLLDAVVLGAPLTLADGKTVGELRSADFHKTTVLCEDGDGKLIPVERNDVYTVLCSMSAKGLFTDRGFLLEGQTPLAPGHRITLKTPTLTATVLITDISAVG